MNDQRKDEGGAVVIFAAGCLVIVLCLVMAGVGWVAIRRRVAAEQAAAERAELQAMQQATAVKAMSEERATKGQKETEASPTLPADVRWAISITDGLNAHFKQTAGPSKPGTDWFVVLRRGSEEKRILVRTYSDAAGQGSAQQAKRAADYVAKLLADGWSPENYKGEPGELIVPDDNVTQP